MQKKSEAHLLREIRKLKRENQLLIVRNEYLQKIHRIAEQKNNNLNKSLTAHKDTISELNETLDYVRSLHPTNL